MSSQIYVSGSKGSGRVWPTRAMSLGPTTDLQALDGTSDVQSFSLEHSGNKPQGRRDARHALANAGQANSQVFKKAGNRDRDKNSGSVSQDWKVAGVPSVCIRGLYFISIPNLQTSQQLRVFC